MCDSTHLHTHLHTCTRSRTRTRCTARRSQACSEAGTTSQSMPDVLGFVLFLMLFLGSYKIVHTTPTHTTALLLHFCLHIIATSATASTAAAGQSSSSLCAGGGALEAGSCEFNVDPKRKAPLCLWVKCRSRMHKCMSILRCPCSKRLYLRGGGGGDGWGEKMIFADEVMHESVSDDSGLI